jgi:ATP-dependent DNA helicase RecG
VKNIETENIEYKQSFADWKAIVESIAAFATASGGTIIVGIDPRGERVGVSLGKGTLEDIANKIKQNTDPAQFPSLSLQTAKGTTVVAIKVGPSPIKPVIAFGKPWKRIGNTNQRLYHSEFKKIVDENEGRFWDGFECRGFTVKHIDRNAIKTFLEKARLSGDTMTVLKNCRLINNKNTLLNGAAVLFAKNPADFHLQSIVKCGRFAGTKPVEFIDQKEFETNIFEQLEKASAFIKTHTFESIIISGDLYHAKKSQYPEKSIREALVNAFCHRDYSVTSNIQVRIFDGFLEIWSPGLLPDGMSVEMLSGRHESLPRNPKIAYVLHRAGLAEQWGTGTNRMIEECNRCGIGIDFESVASSFIVRFTYKTPAQGKRRKIHDASERQRIIDSLLKKSSFSRQEFQEALGISKRQALRELEKLVNEGMARKTGVNRDIRYHAINQ